MQMYLQHANDSQRTTSVSNSFVYRKHSNFKKDKKLTAPEKTQRAVQSVEFGGRLLLALADSQEELGLTDLAARAGMTPSRAHPYLVSYARLELIIQDPLTGRYELGPAALRIGLASLHRLDAFKIADPLVRQLASNTGHAVALTVWGNFGPTIVKLVEAKQALHISLRVGSVLSLFDTATGRAYVGAMPYTKIEAAMAFNAGANSTLKQKKAWRAEAESCKADLKQHGACRAVSRPIPGVNAFSAPAYDHEGIVALALTITDHQDRMPSSWESPSATELRRIASEITYKLGGATI
jgi:DNA-binding IclR family transcriptional regulator